MLSLTTLTFLSITVTLFVVSTEIRKVGVLLVVDNENEVNKETVEVKYVVIFLS